MELSTVAYNIHFGKKLELIEKWLFKNKDYPDLIFLQEFPFSNTSTFLRKLEELGYDYKFAPSSFLTKPIRIKRKHIYGELTIYKKSQVKLVSSHTIKLGTNFLEKRFRVHGEKTSLLTIFKVKNKKLVIANSHLVAYAPNSRRINQITKIIKKVRTLGDHTEFSTVILGDFNYTSRIRQKNLINFMARFNLTNAYRAYTHKYFFISQQIDYVFFDRCEVKNVKIGKKIKYSDHYPVKFIIKL